MMDENEDDDASIAMFWADNLLDDELYEIDEEKPTEKTESSPTEEPASSPKAKICCSWQGKCSY